MASRLEMIQRLSDAVFEMEEPQTVAALAQAYVDAGYPVLDAIMDGLVDGMNRAGVLYEEEEYFVTDLLLCSDAMYAGLEVLNSHLPEAHSGEEKVRAVIGVVEGDTHDIGKNLVRIMMEAAGFEMYDLGRDVPAEDFVHKVKEVDASILCLSTLMTTTMMGMERVIRLLESEGIREQVKVMVGGGPISDAFAQRIGADCYTQNAIEAARVAKELVHGART